MSLSPRRDAPNSPNPLDPNIRNERHSSGRVSLGPTQPNVAGLAARGLPSGRAARSYADAVRDGDGALVADLVQQLAEMGSTVSRVQARLKEVEAEVVVLKAENSTLRSATKQPSLLELQSLVPKFTGEGGDNRVTFQQWVDTCLDLKVQLGLSDARLVEVARRYGLPGGSPAVRFLSDAREDNMTWARLVEILGELYGQQVALSERAAFSKSAELSIQKFVPQGGDFVAPYAAEVTKYAAAAQLNLEQFKVPSFLKGLPQALALQIETRPDGTAWPSLGDLVNAHRGTIMAHFAHRSGSAGGGGGAASGKRAAEGVRPPQPGKRQTKQGPSGAAEVASEWVPPRDLCNHCWIYGHRSSGCPAGNAPAKPRPASCPPRGDGGRGPAVSGTGSSKAQGKKAPQ